MIQSLLLFACGTAPVSPPPVAPAPGHEHADHAEHAEQAQPAAPSTAPPGLPETIASLETHRDQAKAAITNGRLAEVHEVAEAMLLLTVVLPVRAKDLSSTDKNAVTLVATDLKSVLDALHHAADDGNVAESTAALAKVDEHLAKLSAYASR